MPHQPIRYLATGCKRRLVIWEALSGKFNVIYELPVHIGELFNIIYGTYTCASK